MCSLYTQIESAFSIRENLLTLKYLRFPSVLGEHAAIMVQ